MFELQSTKEEDSFAKNEKLLKELALRFNQQEAFFEKLYADYGISKDELLEYLADAKNFDEKTWEEMQKFREEFSSEVQSKLSQVKDTIKIKKSYKDLQYAHRWIPVR